MLNSSVKNSGILRRALTAAALAAACGVCGSAQAQPDRNSNTPTGWLWYLNVPNSTIWNAIGDGFRVIDIEESGGAVNAVLVQNSGEYQLFGQALYAGATATAVSNDLSVNNRRLIDLEPYENSSGALRFYGTATPNTGSNAAGWGWLYNTTSSNIINWVNNNPTPLRLIDIDVYNYNGQRYYSAVAVNNTGSQQQGWWHLYNISSSALSTFIEQNDARIVDLEIHQPQVLFSPATYSAILTPNQNRSWWWYLGQSGTALSEKLDLNAARLVDLEEYSDPFGQTRYHAVMLDNANAATRRLRTLMWNSVSANAKSGAYLKEVGGPVRVAFGVDYVFEPASTLKILHTTYAWDRVAAGLESQATQVWVPDRCNNNECPDGVACDPGWERLDQVIRETMEQSDNNRTKVLHDRYGRSTLNNYATALGMGGTQINHDIGCGLPANELTLRDLGLIWELVADGSLFSTAWRDVFFGLMIDSDESGLPSRIVSIISAEAGSTYLTGQEIGDFRSLVSTASKGGNYGVPSGGNCCLFHRSGGGWARIPFKDSNGNIFFREFVHGVFVNDEPNDTLAAQAVGQAFSELLREPIREALESWDDACDPPVVRAISRDVSVRAGETVTLSVSEGGTQPISEQWRRNGAALSNGTHPSGAIISGATGRTLRIDNAQPSLTGDYRVSLLNDCGSTQSSEVRVTIFCPSDWDESGGVDGDDIAAFFTDWQIGEADFDGSGGTDGDDIGAFFVRWQAGC